MKQAAIQTIGVVLIAIVALVVIADFLGKPAPQQIPPSPVPPSGVVVTPIGVKLACDVSDNKNDVKTAASNVLNTSIDYRANTIVLLVGDTAVDTDTATGGSSLSWKVLDIDCADRSGLVIAKASATIGGGSKAFTIPSERTSTEVVVTGVNNTVNLTKTLRNNALGNVSGPVDSYVANIYEISATSMVKGDSRAGYIDVKMGSSFAIYGGTESKVDAKYTAYGGDAGTVEVGGILWGVDTISSSVFSDSSGFGMSVSDGGLKLTEVSCSRFPNEQAKYSLNRCWLSQAIGQGGTGGLAVANAVSGDLRLKHSVYADLGDPATTDDLVLYAIPLDWYEDKIDGKSMFLYGGVDSNSAYIGKQPNTFTFDNS